MVSIVLPSNPSERCKTSLAFNGMQGVQMRCSSSQYMRYAQSRNRCSDSHSQLGIFGAQRLYPLNDANFRPSAPRPALLEVRRFAKPHGHPTYPRGNACPRTRPRCPMQMVWSSSPPRPRRSPSSAGSRISTRRTTVWPSTRTIAASNQQHVHADGRAQPLLDPLPIHLGNRRVRSFHHRRCCRRHRRRGATPWVWMSIALIAGIPRASSLRALLFLV